jgi:hypothetical protein
MIKLTYINKDSIFNSYEKILFFNKQKIEHLRFNISTNQISTNRKKIEYIIEKWILNDYFYVSEDINVISKIKIRKPYWYGTASMFNSLAYCKQRQDKYKNNYSHGYKVNQAKIKILEKMIDQN